MQHGFFKFWDWFDDRELLTPLFTLIVSFIILILDGLQEPGILSVVSLEALCIPA